MRKIDEKVAIFDMDGTLIDSIVPITKAINGVREHLSLSPIEQIDVKIALNSPQVRPSLLFYNSEEFTQKQKELFEEIYFSCCTQDIFLYDGIYELLYELKSSHKLAVATNADSPYALKMLDHLGVLECFDMVVGANDVDRAKPNPDMLELILQKCSSSKESSFLVGDSMYDKLAAKNLGMEYLYVSWGYGDLENEQRVAHSAKDLRELIDALL